MTTLYAARTRVPVLVRKAVHSPLARRAAKVALVAVPVLASQAFAAGEGEMTAENFTAIGTKILTYLGYAIAAGILVVGAVVAATAGWKFFGKFLKG